MTQYRAKPAIIEAIQWKGSNEGDIMYFIGGCTQPIGDGRLIIPAGEYDITAAEGDWVTKSANGEVGLCKHDTFEETYEAV
jgi:hypothetical protein